MFKHHEIARAQSDNLIIASLLSFVAGFVHVVGCVRVHDLSTNRTARFAFYVYDILNLKINESFILYILFFFSSAFVFGSILNF
jgi:hypothetical protein